MKFEQIRKLVDVLVDDYYTSHFGEEKPSIELTLHTASIYGLQEDIHKSFPDAIIYTRTTSLEPGVKYQINLEGFIINIRESIPEVSKEETKVVDKVVSPIKEYKKNKEKSENKLK